MSLVAITAAAIAEAPVLEAPLAPAPAAYEPLPLPPTPVAPPPVAYEPRRWGDVDENSMYWRYVWLLWIPIYLMIYWVPRL